MKPRNVSKAEAAAKAVLSAQHPPMADTYATPEERDAAWIAEATHFTSTVRHAGQSFTDEHATMAAAGAAARKLESMLAEAGHPKRALVYAVTAQGRAAMVQRDQWLAASEGIDQ